MGGIAKMFKAPKIKAPDQPDPIPIIDQDQEDKMAYKDSLKRRRRGRSGTDLSGGGDPMAGTPFAGSRLG